MECEKDRVQNHSPAPSPLPSGAQTPAAGKPPGVSYQLPSLREDHEEAAFTAKPTTHGPRESSPRQRLPKQLPRRITAEVQARERALREELGPMFMNASHSLEEARKAEEDMVDFALKRILEQQQQQMKVQQELLASLNDMKLKDPGKDAKDGKDAEDTKDAEDAEDAEDEKDEKDDDEKDEKRASSKWPGLFDPRSGGHY